ncbi:MAG: molybdopterin molybdotransferase MoeA [Mycoplasmatales bacterium]
MVKYQEALNIIDAYNFNKKIISINTMDSLDYVLAQDIKSLVDVPNTNKSAMDGYAILDYKEGSSLEIINTIYAGEFKDITLKETQCVKIMTGAPLPSNAKKVIVKELALEENGYVSFNIPSTKLNDNICFVGEDIKKDQVLFSKDTLINATTISSLISGGIFNIEVYAKPNILLLTTGDEVITKDTTLDKGQVYNSNYAYLYSRLKELCFKCSHHHLDDDENLESYINKEYDFVITTGAISVGDKDFIRHYVQDTKKDILFDRVNIMPGGPCMLWLFDNVPVMSLAGSPYANFVTFELFARRILAHLSNNKNLLTKEKTLRLKCEYKKDIKKLRFVKSKFKGHYVDIPANNHLASSMHEMNMCNSFIVLEPGKRDLKENDLVKVIDLRRIYE